MQQVDPQALQLPSAVNDIHCIASNFRYQAAGGVECAALVGELVEDDYFDALITQPIGEHVVLIEHRDRLEFSSVEANDEIEQGLVRPANGSIFVAFDDEYARAATARRADIAR